MNGNHDFAAAIMSGGIVSVQSAFGFLCLKGKSDFKIFLYAFYLSFLSAFLYIFIANDTGVFSDFFISTEFGVFVFAIVKHSRLKKEISER